jgi:hypothetical protein
MLFALWTTAAAADRHQRVEVADPYLELRTGPGRSFPVFHVVDRGQWIAIVKRKTDWFKLRTTQGKTGWANRAQMERTLTEGGVNKSFRDIVLGDYLARRVEFGLAGGTFEGDAVMTARSGLRLTQNLTAELSLSQLSGKFSSSRLYHLNLVSYPFPNWRIAPNFTLGVGRFENAPNKTLVDEVKTDSWAANAGAGVRAYLTRRFMFRVDFKDYLVLVDDNRDEEYREWVAGFSFFF